MLKIIGVLSRETETAKKEPNGNFRTKSYNFQN